ncbi:MAG: hypothetical protein CMB45_05520 [Euryarchaeota archaeon]|nr:hypothetical protein [Euryarchaeota archaeon]MBK38433.1 hypothetical protein [Euryarchaeota archaeon]|tara:strand:+ start:6410 stop:6634 length:225 start_codon:yes stop_codon:yes gene_type:complete
MARGQRTSLREAEENDPVWWCRHYKTAVNYLVIRMYQLLQGDERMRESVTNMMNAQLSAFAETAEVELDEVKLT